MHGYTQGTDAMTWLAKVDEKNCRFVWQHGEENIRDV